MSAAVILVSDGLKWRNNPVRRRYNLDLRVAAVKSTESTWPLQVKSFQFQIFH